MSWRFRPGMSPGAIRRHTFFATRMAKTCDSGGRGKKPELRSKLTVGTSAMLGFESSERLAAAEVVWRVEGLSDWLSLESIIPADLPHVAVSNACGAGERIQDKWLEPFAAKDVLIVADCDKPGMQSAKRWAAKLVRVARSVKLVELPYPITENHGRDLRDWLAEGHTFDDLLELAEQTEPLDPDAIAAEEEDDGKLICNAKVVAGDDESTKEPYSMTAIVDRIRETTDGWPRRVGPGLFVHERDSQIDWLQSVSAFTRLAGHENRSTPSVLQIGRLPHTSRSLRRDVSRGRML